MHSFVPFAIVLLTLLCYIFCLLQHCGKLFTVQPGIIAIVPAPLPFIYVYIGSMNIHGSKQDVEHTQVPNLPFVRLT